MEKYSGKSARKYSLMQLREIKDKMEASIHEQNGIDRYVYTPEQWAGIKEQRAINAANISRLIKTMEDKDEHTTPARVSWPEYVVEELNGIKNEWIEGEWHCNGETLTRDDGRILLYVPDIQDIPNSIVDILSKEFIETNPHYYAAPFNRRLVSSIRAELAY